MPVGRSALVALLARFGARLRFPTLFGLLALLFVLDLVVPDAIPFADELLLGLATLVVGSLRKRGGDDADSADTQS